jgi:hypothetical protein
LPLALLPPCCWLLPPAVIFVALLAGDSAALCLLSTAVRNSFAVAVQTSFVSPVDPAYREHKMLCDGQVHCQPLPQRI